MPYSTNPDIIINNIKLTLYLKFSGIAFWKLVRNTKIIQKIFDNNFFQKQ